MVHILSYNFLGPYKQKICELFPPFFSFFLLMCLIKKKIEFTLLQTGFVHFTYLGQASRSAHVDRSPSPVAGVTTAELSQVIRSLASQQAADHFLSSLQTVL